MALCLSVGRVLMASMRACWSAVLDGAGHVEQAGRLHDAGGHQVTERVVPEPGESQVFLHSRHKAKQQAGTPGQHLRGHHRFPPPNQPRPGQRHPPPGWRQQSCTRDLGTPGQIKLVMMPGTPLARRNHFRRTPGQPKAGSPNSRSPKR